jgi:integrase
MPGVDKLPAAVATFKLEYLPTLAVSTRKEHERNLDRIAEDFAAFRVAEVRPTDVSRFLKNNFHGKPTSRRHYKARLSTFSAGAWKRAARRQPVPRCVGQRRHRSTSRNADASFTRSDDKLPPMLQVYLDLSFLLYQRATDVRRLRWSQVRGKVIHFEPTKTAKSSGAEVDIPVTPEITAVLERARTLAKVKPGPGGDAFVIQSRSGSPYTHFGISSAIERAAIAVGLAKKEGPASGLTAKDLRPTPRVRPEQGYSLEVRLGSRIRRDDHGEVRAAALHAVSQVTLRLPRRP